MSFILFEKYLIKQRIAVYSDVIPENRRFNLRTYEKGRELELEEHDVSDVCASSHDPKYPPSSSLLNQHSHKIGWVSTGKDTFLHT